MPTQTPKLTAPKPSGGLPTSPFVFSAFWGVPAGASTIFLVVRAPNWRDRFSAQHGSSLDAGIAAERSHVASTDTQKMVNMAKLN